MLCIWLLFHNQWLYKYLRKESLISDTFKNKIFPLNNSLSLPLLLLPLLPPSSFMSCSTRLEECICIYIYITKEKENVLLDVFLCIKDSKIGKGCCGALAIPYLYSHTHLWQKQPPLLEKINTSFNFYVFSFISYYQRHMFLFI